MFKVGASSESVDAERGAVAKTILTSKEAYEQARNNPAT
jgi:hypothetical protein